MKHNFYELKKSNKPLPEDVNTPVEMTLDDIFHDKELNAKMIDARTKRKFREIGYARGNLACEVSFVRGVIPKYFLISTVTTSDGGRMVVKDSVQNDNLIYPKDNE
ncbi:hypothetical protein CCP3SC15_380028 [Gammaproteobacteria bacterium]